MNKEEMKARFEGVRYKVQVKMEDLKHGARKVKEVIAKCAEEHPLETLTAGITVIGMGVGAVKSASNAYNEHCEKVRRDTDFYDTRTGRHVIVKRPLKTHEAVEADERFGAGESYVQIFNDMGLLKR